MNPLTYQYACKLLKIDPITGKKAKLKFSHFERNTLLQKVVRIHSVFIKDSNLSNDDIFKIIDDIKSGFANGHQYFLRFYKHLNQTRFLEMFYFISREIIQYK